MSCLFYKVLLGIWNEKLAGSVFTIITSFHFSACFFFRLCQYDSSNLHCRSCPCYEPWYVGDNQSAYDNFWYFDGKSYEQLVVLHWKWRMEVLIITNFVNIVVEGKRNVTFCTLSVCVCLRPHTRVNDPTRANYRTRKMKKNIDL